MRPTINNCAILNDLLQAALRRLAAELERASKAVAGEGGVQAAVGEQGELPEDEEEDGDVDEERAAKKARRAAKKEKHLQKERRRQDKAAAAARRQANKQASL